MSQIQLESLVVKAVIFSLALIMFIVVPWMEVLGSGVTKGGQRGAELRSSLGAPN